MRRVSIVTERGVSNVQGSGEEARVGRGRSRAYRHAPRASAGPRRCDTSACVWGGGGRAVGNGRATGGGDGPRAVSPRVRPRGGVEGRQTPGRAGHIRPGAPARIRFDGVAELGVCAQVAGSTSVTGLTLKTLKSDVSMDFSRQNKNNGGSRRFFRCYSRDVDDCSLVRLKRKTPN